MAIQTLGERVKAALQGPPKRTQRALAAAVGISPVSVNDWVYDRTKTIEGAHLLRAASFLGVSPKWLAEGKGPMRASGADTAALEVDEPVLSVATALPVVLDAMRTAPAAARAELAQVLGLFVTTSSTHYAQRVFELLTADNTCSDAPGRLAPPQLTADEIRNAKALTRAIKAAEAFETTPAKHAVEKP